MRYREIVNEATPSKLEDPGFAAWFGRSQVVDSSGQPLIVYHGTRAQQPVSVFSQQHAAATGRWTQDAGADIGFHFSPEEETAGLYGKVGRYYLKIERPLQIDESDVFAAQDRWLADLEYSDDRTDQELADFIRATKAFDNPGTGYYNYGLMLLANDGKTQGHDGVIFTRRRDFTDDRPIDEYIAFHPDQIRPAA